MSLKYFSVSAIFIIFMVYIERTFVLSGYYGASDFYRFYQSLLFYFAGQDIYSSVIVTLNGSVRVLTSGNLNPPFFTLLLWPFHFFNYSSAYQLWNMILLGCLLLGAYLVLRPFPQWHKNTAPIMALFALYVPNSESLSTGEIASILLVILAAAWLLSRKNKDLSAGFCIGLACALKLFFGLFLIYFLCLKRFRLIFTAGITIVASGLLGAWIFGSQSYFSYHAELDSIYWYAMSWNASFYGFFTRLFSHTEGNAFLVIAPRLAIFFTVFFSIILTIGLIRFWRKQSALQFDRGFSLVIIAMLLLSPLGWVYYFPLLLIPYLVFIAEGNTWIHLIACILLMMSTLTGTHLMAPQIKTMAQLLVCSGIGFYVLLGMLGLGMWRSHAEAPDISENLWVLIYAVIFIPSLISLGTIFRGLM